MDMRNELFEIFIQETKENIEVLGEGLLILEKDNDNKDQINLVFRMFHTIKGSTAFMGFTKVAEFVHHIEDLIQAVREDKEKLTSPLCNHLLKCQDFLSMFIDDVEQGRTENTDDIEPLLAKLEEIRHSSVSSKEAKSKGNKQKVLQEPVPFTFEKHLEAMIDREEAVVLRVTLDDLSAYKAVRAWMVFKELTNSGELLWSNPPKPSDEDFSLGLFSMASDEIIAQVVPSIAPDEIKHVIEKIGEILKVEILKMPGKTPVGDQAYDFRFETKKEQNAKYYDFLNEQIVESKRTLDNFIGNLNDNGLVWDLYRCLHTIKGIMGFTGEKRVFGLVGVMEQILKKQRGFDDENKMHALSLVANALEVMEAIFLESKEENPNTYEQEMEELVIGMKGLLGVTIHPALSVEVPQIIKVESGSKETEAKSGSTAAASVSDGTETAMKEVLKPSVKPIQAVSAQEKTTLEVKMQSYIRIPEAKVGSLVDLLGELLILQSLHREEVSLMTSNGNEVESKVINNLMRMERITKEIQTISMSLRMVSLKQSLQKLQRIGHDTSVELVKDVHMEIVGEETEIDRSIVEKIQDPLMHLVRNSISHGIEEAEVRASVGKPTTGTVRISAYNKRGSVYIEIADDGKGLNVEKIHKKAIERGLVDPEANLTVEEILKTIYMPGFSMAESINSISGRGVGMNVVETEIQKIGGRIEIKNDEGKGCTFVLKIPINLATINGTVVEVGNSKYIIPTMNVKHILKPVDEQFIKVKNKKKMITIRKESYQIIELDKLFELKTSETDRILETGVIVIIEVDQKFKAFPVDRVIGKQEIVLKPLGKEFRNYTFLSGATILGDGTVSLILDVETVFKLTEENFTL